MCCELFRAVLALSQEASVLCLHTGDKWYLNDKVSLATCVCPEHAAMHGDGGQRFPSRASAQCWGLVRPHIGHCKELLLLLRHTEPKILTAGGPSQVETTAR